MSRLADTMRGASSSVMTTSKHRCAPTRHNGAMTAPPSLGPQGRTAALEAVQADELDVLVVGGGVVGVGTALDAVTRGLSCGLLEQRDLARHLVAVQQAHPRGLRYLEMLDFGLVREALQERGLLSPGWPRTWSGRCRSSTRYRQHWERPYVGAGLALYDAMAMAGKYPMGVPAPPPPSPSAVPSVAPDLRPEVLTGAVQYYDCQVDDARLHRHRRPHRRAPRRPRGDPHQGDRLPPRGRAGHRRRARRDLETGRELEVRARVVVNTAGVWTDEIQEMVGGRGVLNVQASKGIHLVVPRDRIRSDTGLILRTETSVLFVIPWGRHWIIGTTDTAVGPRQGAPGGVAARTSTTSSSTSTASSRSRWTTRTSRGCTPGCGRSCPGESEPTSRDLARAHGRHAVPGLVLMAGGKYTTYRVMAKDAVDAAAHRSARAGARQHHRPGAAVGAEGFETRSNQTLALSRRSGVHLARIEHLLGRYGDLIDELLDLVDGDPSWGGPCPALRTTCGPRSLRRDPRGRPPPRRRAHPPHPHLHRDLRPRRLGGPTRRRAHGCGTRLGRDVEDEVDHYLRRVEAERQSQRQPPTRRPTRPGSGRGTSWGPRADQEDEDDDVGGNPAHARWLEREGDDLLRFAAGSVHPDGGFAWLDDTATRSSTGRWSCGSPAG